MKKTLTTLPWFGIISWLITVLIAAGLLIFAFWRINNPGTVVPPTPTQAALEQKHTPLIPTISASAVNVSWFQLPSIERKLTLKTDIPQRPRYAVLTRTVQRGDALSRIAKEFNIEPDTLLFANYDVLRDSADALQPGQELNVPPTDGILYQWKPGDKLEKIAADYKAKLEDVINWPGNNIDLTNPVIKANQFIMIPGGTRDSRAQVIETAGGGGGPGGCASAAHSRGFWSWPTGTNYLSGNDYSAGHPGIDIAANEGDPIYAADSGVVTMSQDGYNSGYGSVIQIYHGNGFTSLYAHLSVRNVSQCQVVGGGAPIGAAGNTGNSFGAHLHFEIRSGGSHVNPWDYLP
jgi:murein DD-endopeptidase MepM/ murein hydrolase activator NlpD